MRAKISNTLSLSVAGLNFTHIFNPQVYIKQSNVFLEYTPTVISSSELIVSIPLKDAMLLKQGVAKIQLAFKDEYGNSLATDILEVSVEDLLKEAGYA